ncbi:MAG: hypothetical protein M3Y09_02900 [Actinomycetota bacterium]|nr:hypothetical protein [Actinomycetota bacterium]
MAVATEVRPARAGGRARTRFGPDRLTVAMLTVSAFLFVLAALGSQLQAAPVPARHRMIVVRRIYQTRVVVTIKGQGGAPGRAAAGSSVTQSVSSSGSAAAPAPTTRVSGRP